MHLCHTIHPFFPPSHFGRRNSFADFRRTFEQIVDDCRSSTFDRRRSSMTQQKILPIRRNNSLKKTIKNLKKQIENCYITSTYCTELKFKHVHVKHNLKQYSESPLMWSLIMLSWSNLSRLTGPKSHFLPNVGV